MLDDRKPHENRPLGKSGLSVHQRLSYLTTMYYATSAQKILYLVAPLLFTVFGIAPAEIGFHMGTITAGFVCGSFLAARYARRYVLATTILCGRIVACAGPLIGLALLFGGATLHHFALALTIGICFGIYSSVLVMAPLVMWLGVRREDLVKPVQANRDGAVV